jgi:hypothetical protein
MPLHPGRNELYRVWLGDGLEFRPGPSFRTLQDANRYAMRQPKPEHCSVECPDGSWVSPGDGLVREVLSWREPIPEVRPAPASRAIEDELRAYLEEDDEAHNRDNRRSSRRIRVQHRASLILNPGRLQLASKPVVQSAIADASDSGLGLRFIDPIDTGRLRPHDPLWIQVEGNEGLELPGRVAWIHEGRGGVRIRLVDQTIEDKYHTWLQRAAFALKLSDES